MSEFKVIKTLEDKNLVFGWGSVSSRVNGEVVKDFEEDIVDIDSLERVSYDFVLKYRDANINHAGPSVGDIVECVCFTKEKMKAMGIPEGVVPEAMWLGFKVNDATFAKVKSGDLGMFSIEGSGKREEV